MPDPIDLRIVVSQNETDELAGMVAATDCERAFPPLAIARPGERSVVFRIDLD